MNMLKWKPASGSSSSAIVGRHAFAAICAALALGCANVVLAADGANAAASPAIDLPSCRDVEAQPTAAAPIRVGLAAQPGETALARHLVNLAAFYDDVTACAERWNDALPLATPVAKQAAAEKYHGYGAYVLAFLLTVLLARFLTPAKWWERFNLFALLVLVGGTWGIATAMLGSANALGLTQRLFYESLASVQIGVGAERWQEVAGVRGFDQWLARAGFKPNFSAQSLNVRSADGAPLTGYREPNATSGAPIGGDQLASGLATTGKRAVVEDGRVMIELRNGRGDIYWVDGGTLAYNPVAAKAGDAYRVHLPLNFRTGPGVDHPRIATLPRGARCSATGNRSGDWWEVKTTVAAGEKTGWVSSLWLRRVGE